MSAPGSAQPEGADHGEIALIEEIPAPSSLVVLADLGGRPGQPASARRKPGWGCVIMAQVRDHSRRRDG